MPSTIPLIAGWRVGTRAVGVILVLVLSLLAAPAPHARQAAGDTEPLVLGVLPFVQPTLLFKRFGTLRDLLSQRLDRPIRLETAPSFPEFVRRTRAQRYDILWTAPHFALEAADSGAYQVLATWVKPVVGVVAVRNDSPIRSLSALSGRTIATPPDSAIVTLVTRGHLDRAGLAGRHAPRYLARTGHMTSRFMVLSGKSDAAIFERHIMEDAKRKDLPLRKLAEAPGVPGAVVLARRAHPDSLRSEIRRHLLHLGDTESGRAALAATTMPAYRAATLADLAPLRPYLDDIDTASRDTASTEQ